MILLTVGFPERVHFIIVKLLEFILLVFYIHFVGSRSLRVEVFLIVHVVVLKVSFYEIVVLFSVSHI